MLIRLLKGTKRIAIAALLSFPVSLFVGIKIHDRTEQILLSVAIGIFVIYPAVEFAAWWIRGLKEWERRDRLANRS